MWHLTNQASLRRCRLQLQDRRLQRAWLFPIFDGSGATRALMLLPRDSPRIFLVAWQPGRFVKRTLRPHLLHLRYEDLSHAEQDEAQGLAHLWHFDPWWKLGEERYAGHPAVPELKATNLPGFQDSITEVHFTSDLSRVASLGYGYGEALQIRKFSPAALDGATRRRARESPQPSSTTASTATWRLRPFWQRGAAASRQPGPDSFT